MNAHQLAGAVLSGEVTIQDALKRVEAEQLDSLRDGERLDYLDDPMTADRIDVGYSEDATWGYVHNGNWYSTFRAAVDAAMARV